MNSDLLAIRRPFSIRTRLVLKTTFRLIFFIFSLIMVVNPWRFNSAKVDTILSEVIPGLRETFLGRQWNYFSFGPNAGKYYRFIDLTNAEAEYYPVVQTNRYLKSFLSSQRIAIRSLDDFAYFAVPLSWYCSRHLSGHQFRVEIGFHPLPNEARFFAINKVRGHLAAHIRKNFDFEKVRACP